MTTYWLLDDELQKARTDANAPVRIFAALDIRPLDGERVTIREIDRETRRQQIGPNTEWASVNKPGELAPVSIWSKREGSSVATEYHLFRDVAVFTRDGGTEVRSGAVIACVQANMTQLNPNPSADRAYFVRMVDGKRDAMMAGPFTDHLIALLFVDRVREAAINRTPEAAFCSFGTVSISQPSAALALVTVKLNDELGLTEAVRGWSSGVPQAIRRSDEHYFESMIWGRRPIEALTLLRTDPSLVNSRCGGDQPLNLAISTRQHDLVVALIEAGADVNVTSVRDYSPLMVAAKGGMSQRDITLKLLRAGADVHARGDYGQSPLHLASESLDSETVSEIIAAGADIDARDFLARTPLMMAARFENIAAVRVLIDAGADVAATDREGNSVMYRVKDEIILQELQSSRQSPPAAPALSSRGMR